MFVHCRFGASRSASVVIAYLLCQLPPMSLADALEYARWVRPTINPIDSFMRQPEKFEGSPEHSALRSAMAEGDHQPEDSTRRADSVRVSERRSKAVAKL